MTNEMIINGLTETLHNHELSIKEASCISVAINALEKADKYRWHDLRKDPNDLPKEHHNFYPVHDSSFSDYVLVITDKWNIPTVAYINLSVQFWFNPLTEQTFEDEKLGNVIAWKEIEPFEVEE